MDVESGTAQVVSEERFAVEFAKNERAFEDASTPGQKRKIWDNVNHWWTPSFPIDQIPMNLGMIIAKCSVHECVYTSHDIGGKVGMVETHIEQTKRSAEIHKDAVIQNMEREGEIIPYCSACRKQFRARPHLANEHVAREIEDGKKHKDATKITIRRFTEGPPVPVAVAKIPEASQEDQSESPRPRRRRRPRKRGKRDNGR